MFKKIYFVRFTVVEQTTLWETSVAEAFPNIFIEYNSQLLACSTSSVRNQRKKVSFPTYRFTEIYLVQIKKKKTYSNLTIKVFNENLPHKKKLID